MASKNYFVYILSSISRVLYIGVTNDLQRRVLEHKGEKVQGFTKRYRVKKLVYFEMTDDVYVALSVRKNSKNGAEKRRLISLKQ